MKAYLAVRCLAEVYPGLPGLSKLIRVGTPNKFLDSLLKELNVLQIVFPDLEGSLHFFPAVLCFTVPDRLQRFVFSSVYPIGVLLSIAPHIEHLSKKLFAHEDVTQILFL